MNFYLILVIFLQVLLTSQTHLQIFKNKVVIVTGASGGIGKAIVIKLNAEGARIALIGRNLDKLQAVAALCTDALVIPADVTNDEDCVNVINKTVEKFGQLDVLINNAGTIPIGSLFDGKILEAYDKAMKEKVRAVIYLTTLSIPHLIQTKGNIVNISGAGSKSVPRVANGIMLYTALAAMDYFSKCAAAELAPKGIRVNVISPGPVNTSLRKNAGLNVTTDMLMNLTALNRVSEPDEIADLVLFVASKEAKSITGSNYVIDNGYLLK